MANIAKFKALKGSPVNWNSLGVQKSSMPNLQQLRQRAGLTQQQLSDLSGVNLRTIRSYEWQQRDIFKASGNILLALSKALGVDVADLLK